MTDFIVTNLDDNGAGSLREAIQDLNATAPGSSNTISFAVAGTIVLASDLPDISRPVFLVAGNTATGNPPTVGIDFNGNAGLLFATGSQGSQLVGLALGDASGNGGFVETSAGRVQIGEATRVTTRAPQGRSGTYEETITLGGKAGASREYRLSGTFSLQRISPVSTLTTQ